MNEKVVEKEKERANEEDGRCPEADLPEVIVVVAEDVPTVGRGPHLQDSSGEEGETVVAAVIGMGLHEEGALASATTTAMVFESVVGDDDGSAALRARQMILMTIPGREADVEVVTDLPRVHEEFPGRARLSATRSWITRKHWIFTKRRVTKLTLRTRR